MDGRRQVQNIATAADLSRPPAEAPPCPVLVDMKGEADPGMGLCSGNPPLCPWTTQ
jgi:hypothetical protein